VKSGIPSRFLTNYKLPIDIQIIPIELILNKRKWILISVYRPPKQSASYFLNFLSEFILYYSTYDSIIINGDLNLEPDSPVLSNFLHVNSLYNHMKKKTCWKSKIGSCIDLIISNKKHSFMNTGTVETGLSDHHLLIYTMLKSTYTKFPPKTVKYRKWKNFSLDLFKHDLTKQFEKVKIDNYATFENNYTAILEKHAL